MADPIFHVSYSYTSDLSNYIRQLRNKLRYQYGMNVLEMSKKYFPEDFLHTVVDASTDTEAEVAVLEYWQKTRPKDFVPKIISRARELEEYLNQHQNLVIDPLEKLYQHQFAFNNVQVYLTTFYRCPYNYPYWYMAYHNASEEKLIDISVHELNHFMFYNYWKTELVKRGITDRQLEYLKEAVAVLTSHEPEKENRYKTEILAIQKFVYENKDKQLDKIINLVIEKKLLADIK